MHMLACSSSAPLTIGSIKNTWLAKLQAGGPAEAGLIKYISLAKKAS